MTAHPDCEYCANTRTGTCKFHDGRCHFIKCGRCLLSHSKGYKHKCPELMIALGNYRGQKSHDKTPVA